MDKAKYFKEAAFRTWEDMEKHLALAASIKADMQETLRKTMRPDYEGEDEEHLYPDW